MMAAATKFHLERMDREAAMGEDALKAVAAARTILANCKYRWEKVITAYGWTATTSTSTTFFTGGTGE